MTAYNSHTLARIRELRGLSRASVAQALGTSVSIIEKHEAGDKCPTLLQLQKLSYFYGVPEYTLIGDSVRNIDPSLPDFRTEKNTPFRDCPNGLGAILKRETEAKALAGLAEAAGIAPKKLKIDIANHKGLSKHAPKVLEKLYFDHTNNKLTSDPHLALRYARSKIEEYGIFTLAVNVPVNSYRGVYKNIDPNWSMILVNIRTFSPKARLFTLFHELGHHLIKQQGVSNPLITQNAIEIECNKFASQMLASDQFITSAFKDSFNKNSHILDVIRSVSDKTLLSNLATAYRLHENDLIKSSQLKEFIKSSGFIFNYGNDTDHEKIESEQEGGSWHLNVVSDFGIKSIQIIHESISKNIIDNIDAARFLNAHNKNLDKAIKLYKNRSTDFADIEEAYQ